MRKNIVRIPSEDYNFCLHKTGEQYFLDVEDHTVPVSNAYAAFVLSSILQHKEVYFE